MRGPLWPSIRARCRWGWWCWAASSSSSARLCLGAVVALLDHELGALAQGHGVTDRVAVEHAGALCPDVRGTHGNLIFQTQRTYRGGPVERNQGVQLAEASGHEAPVGVERSALVGVGVEDDDSLDTWMCLRYALELCPQPVDDANPRGVHGWLGRFGSGRSIHRR